MEGLVSPFEILAQGIVNLSNFFSDILGFINPTSDNFILKPIIDFFSNLISYVNPLSENFLGKKLIELFSDLLKYLFVPTQDQFSEINDKFNEKFGFFEQVKELVSNLFSYHDTSSYSLNNDYPSWDITYEGVTVSIIDFSLFDEYRGLVHSIIIGVMYISFLWRLYRRLPGVINSAPDL